MYLTNSEMSTFRRCKRRWWLGNYRELAPRAQDSAPLRIGSLVHAGLEVVYDPDRQDEDPVAAVRSKVDETLEGVSLERQADVRKEGDLAEIMVAGYMDWLEETGADMDLELESVETPVDAVLNDTVTLRAKLDARVRSRSTGARWALEHKTTGSLSQALPLLQIDTQLLTEHLVEYLTAGTYPDGVIYNMLRKVKRTASANPPFYGREEVRHNEHELRNHLMHVLGIAQEIAEARAALNAGGDPHTVCYPSPDQTCSWQCQFFRVCPLFDDGSDAEAALADLYEHVDPLERYADLAPDTS